MTVVPNAVDSDTFRLGDAQQSRSRVEPWVGEGPYLLYVSRIEHPGKNHLRLIRAYEELRSAARIGHRLVLAGGDWNGSEVVRRAAEQSQYRDDIVFPGFIPEERLPDLYRGADAMVFPSLYEGFGLPILEAMACGVPVACSNVSSMPEVAGSAAIQFDPSSSSEIARAMAMVLSESPLRSTLRELGLEQSRRFTWRKSASRTMSALVLVARRTGGKAVEARLDLLERPVIAFHQVSPTDPSDRPRNASRVDFESV